MPSHSSPRSSIEESEKEVASSLMDWKTEDLQIVVTVFLCESVISTGRNICTWYESTAAHRVVGTAKFKSISPILMFIHVALEIPFSRQPQWRANVHWLDLSEEQLGPHAPTSTVYKNGYRFYGIKRDYCAGMKNECKGKNNYIQLIHYNYDEHILTSIAIMRDKKSGDLWSIKPGLHTYIPTQELATIVDVICYPYKFYYVLFALPSL